MTMVFRVLTLNDLGYDTKNNLLFIKPAITGMNQSQTVDANLSDVTYREGDLS